MPGDTHSLPSHRQGAPQECSELPSGPPLGVKEGFHSWWEHEAS